MTLSVLHVASFHGNIGDNANHAGFRDWFEHLAGQPVEWLEFEIRDVFRGTRAFDAGFVAAANAADLVVIGGGNYFELWVERSPTGTSISIEEEQLEQIRVPIFFNSLGVDDAQGVPAASRENFGKFIQTLLGSEQFLVSVRNDGSFATLQRRLPSLPVDRILQIPDGGFFASYPRGEVTRGDPVAAQPRGSRIAISLAGDMRGLRFPGGDGVHAYDSFVREFAEALTAIWTAKTRCRFVMFPHIFSDLQVYADVLAMLPDKLRREGVSVAEYNSGEAAAEHAFGQYLGCDVVLGMRFHANVVPIGHGIPTIGLGCYPQIARLYEELRSCRSVIDVARMGFSDLLVSHVLEILENGVEARVHAEGMKSIVKEARSCSEPHVRHWLERHQLAGQP